MCTTKRPSVPATPLMILSMDLVYYKASTLLAQMACGSWKPALELSTALEAYAELRQISIIRTAQGDDGPAPTTERSRGTEIEATE